MPPPPEWVFLLAAAVLLATAADPACAMANNHTTTEATEATDDGDFKVLSLSDLRISFADGRDALVHDGARRRRASVTSGDAGGSIHVHFAAEGTDYDMDLELLPSIFVTDATVNLTSSTGSLPAADSEPPAYGDQGAVFVLGSHGRLSGTVHTSDGELRIIKKDNKILGRMVPSNALLMPHGSCGSSGTDAQADVVQIHTTHGSSNVSDMMPGVGHSSKDVVSPHRGGSKTRNPSNGTAHAGGGGRVRRAIDSWTGDGLTGQCYEGDQRAGGWVLKMGVLIGNRAFVRLGGTTEGATEFLTGQIQNANIVFRAQMNLGIRVTSTTVSENLGDLEFDSTSPASVSPSCSDTITQTLAKLSEYGADPQQQQHPNALYHFFDTCSSGAVGKAGRGSVCSPGSGVTYVNPRDSDHWRTFAHEVGHNLGAPHPFAGDTQGAISSPANIGDTTITLGNGFSLGQNGQLARPMAAGSFFEIWSGPSTTETESGVISAVDGYVVTVSSALRRRYPALSAIKFTEKGTTGGIMDYVGNAHLTQSDGTSHESLNGNAVPALGGGIYTTREYVCGTLASRLFSSTCANKVESLLVVCGDGLLHGDETCECADGTSSCSHCSNCQLAAGKECTRDSAEYSGEERSCLCSADGMLLSCDGICGPNGSCQVDYHDCAQLSLFTITTWEQTQTGEWGNPTSSEMVSDSCGLAPRNNCEALCSDHPGNCQEIIQSTPNPRPSHCNGVRSTAGYCGWDWIIGMGGSPSNPFQSMYRPAQFLKEGTHCLDVNGVWSTCQSTVDPSIVGKGRVTGISCLEVECGNGRLDYGEPCDCADGTLSCAHCSNCQLAAGKECSRDSAARYSSRQYTALSFDCLCSADGMLQTCDGVCGPNGSCQSFDGCANPRNLGSVNRVPLPVNEQVCGMTNIMSRTFWASTSNGAVRTGGGNTCQVVCRDEDTRDCEPFRDISKNLSPSPHHRPVTWLPDGAHCLDVNGAWSTCQSTVDPSVIGRGRFTGISCLEVECGNGRVDYGEACDCADGTLSCADCSNCQLAAGKECSRDSADHSSVDRHCLCSAEGMLQTCDGICGPNGSCQTDYHNCGALAGLSAPQGFTAVPGVFPQLPADKQVCGLDSSNTCKVVCADGRNWDLQRDDPGSFPDLDNLFCGTKRYTSDRGLDQFRSPAPEDRPLTFMPAGTHCLDVNGAWSTCATEGRGRFSSISCLEVRCGNGRVDYGETCDCADGTLSCAHCSNCQFTAGKECSRDAVTAADYSSVDRHCLCSAAGMLQTCDGVCGPEGSCVTDLVNHNCASLAQYAVESDSCGVDPGNNCKVVCSDGLPANENNCEAGAARYFHVYNIDTGGIERRPATFMKEGAFCVDVNGAWSTCAREGSAISCLEARCGNRRVDYGETCDCADGTLSCADCSNCQLAEGKECSRDSTDHSGVDRHCLCSAEGMLQLCDGICGPNDSCVTDYHSCADITPAAGGSCGVNPDNNCKVVCSEGLPATESNCNTNFESDTVSLESSRPVTFMKEGTFCVDVNGAWSACATEGGAISCPEVRCGNGYVDVGETCDCATGALSCAHCNDCQLDSGKECSRGSADYRGADRICLCSTGGMLTTLQTCDRATLITVTQVTATFDMEFETNPTSDELASVSETFCEAFRITQPGPAEPDCSLVLVVPGRRRRRENPTFNYVMSVTFYQPIGSSFSEEDTMVAASGQLTAVLEDLPGLSAAVSSGSTSSVEVDITIATTLIGTAYAHHCHGSCLYAPTTNHGWRLHRCCRYTPTTALVAASARTHFDTR